MESCWEVLSWEESDSLVRWSEDRREGTTLLLQLTSVGRVVRLTLLLLILTLRRRRRRVAVPIEDRLSNSQPISLVRLLDLLLRNQPHRVIHRLVLMNPCLPQEIRQPEIFLSSSSSFSSSSSSSSSSDERLTREHRGVIQLRTVAEMRRRVAGVERSDPSMVPERRGMALKVRRRNLDLILVLLLRDEELLRRGRSVESGERRRSGSGSELVLLLDGRREDVLRLGVDEDLLLLGLFLRSKAEAWELVDGVVERLLLMLRLMLSLELLLLLLRLMLTLGLEMLLLLLLLSLGSERVLECRVGSSDLRGEGRRPIRVSFENRRVVSFLLELGSLQSTVLLLLLIVLLLRRLLLLELELLLGEELIRVRRGPPTGVELLLLLFNLKLLLTVGSRLVLPFLFSGETSCSSGEDVGGEGPVRIGSDGRRDVASLMMLLLLLLPTRREVGRSVGRFVGGREGWNEVGRRSGRLLLTVSLRTADGALERLIVRRRLVRSNSSVEGPLMTKSSASWRGSHLVGVVRVVSNVHRRWRRRSRSSRRRRCCRSFSFPSRPLLLPILLSLIHSHRRLLVRHVPPSSSFSPDTPKRQLHRLARRHLVPKHSRLLSTERRLPCTTHRRPVPRLSSPYRRMLHRTHSEPYKAHLSLSQLSSHILLFLLVVVVSSSSEPSTNVSRATVPSLELPRIHYSNGRAVDVHLLVQRSRGGSLTLFSEGVRRRSCSSCSAHEESSSQSSWRRHRCRFSYSS